MTPDFGKIIRRIRDSFTVPFGESRVTTTSALALVSIIILVAFVGGVSIGSLQNYPSVGDMSRAHAVVQYVKAQRDRCRVDLEAALQRSTAIETAAQTAAEQLTACLGEKQR